MRSQIEVWPSGSAKADVELADELGTTVAVGAVDVREQRPRCPVSSSTLPIDERAVSGTEAEFAVKSLRDGDGMFWNAGSESRSP